MDKRFYKNIENFLVEIPCIELGACIESIVSENFNACIVFTDSSDSVKPVGVLTSETLQALQSADVNKLLESHLSSLLAIDVDQDPMGLLTKFQHENANFAVVYTGPRILGYVSKDQLSRGLIDLFYQDQEIVEGLENLVRDKERQLAILTHDIRSPLFVISGSCNFLRRLDPESSSFQPRFNKFVSLIENSSRNATRLAKDLLDLAAIRNEVCNAFQFDVLDVAGVVQKEKDSLEMITNARGLQLELDIQARLEAHLHPMRFMQILENLTNNAAKFSPPSSTVYITVKEWHKQDIAFVAVEVADEGPGIPEGQIEKIFEEFKRTDRDRHSDVEGVGLGLHIAKQFVDHHQGIIEAENLPEKGALFRVLIPVSTSLKKQNELSNPNATLAFLVVEDDEHILDFLEEALIEEGFQPTLARGYDEAQRLIRNQPFDLMLSDVNLGSNDGNGFDLVKKVKENNKASIAFLMSSYYPGFDGQFEKSPIKPDKFLAKPFAKKQLSKVLKSTLEKFRDS